MSDEIKEVAAPAPAVATPAPQTFAEQARAELQPTVPAEVAAPVAAPVEPVVSAQAKSRILAEYLNTQYGADLGDVSDEELAPQIGHMLEESQLLQQRLAERERQLSEYLASQNEFQEFRSSKAQSKEAASQEKLPAEPKVKPLQYDPDWEHLASLDKDTGLWSPKAKFGLQAIEAAEKLNIYQREQADRARRLVSDPWSLMREAGFDNYAQQLKAEIIKEMEDRVNSIPKRWEQERQQEQVVSQMQSWIDNRQGDLFALDAKGQPLTRAGQYVLSEKGRAYQQAAAEAKEVLGLNDPHRIHAYASRIYEARFANTAAAPQAPVAPPAPEPTVQETNEALKRKFLEKGHVPASIPTNRDGAHLAAAKDGRPGNSFLRFREMVQTDPNNAEILGVNFKG